MQTDIETKTQLDDTASLHVISSNVNVLSIVPWECYHAVCSFAVFFFYFRECFYQWIYQHWMAPLLNDLVVISASNLERGTHCYWYEVSEAWNLPLQNFNRSKGRECT